MKYSFSFPKVFLLAILLIPYILYRIQYNHSTALKYAPLQFQTVKKKFFRFYFLLFLESILFLSMLFVAADPYTTEERALIQDEGVDVALVLDVSASMQATDFTPNRMEFMKSVSTQFVKRSSGHRIGVFIFAQETFTQAMFTFDHPTLEELIESINYKVIDHSLGGGTAIGDAILTVAESMLNIRVNDRDQVLILITDGENSFGTEPELAAKYLASKGIKLYIIGMAGDNPIPVYVDGYPFITPSGKQLITSLDDASLKKIAEAGNGVYYRALDGKELNAIFEEISKLSKKPIEVDKIYNKISYAHNFGLYLLGLFLVILLFFAFFVRSPMR